MNNLISVEQFLEVAVFKNSIAQKTFTTFFVNQKIKLTLDGWVNLAYSKIGNAGFDSKQTTYHWLAKNPIIEQEEFPQEVIEVDNQTKKSKK